MDSQQHLYIISAQDWHNVSTCNVQQQLMEVKWWTGLVSYDRHFPQEIRCQGAYNTQAPPHMDQITSTLGQLDSDLQVAQQVLQSGKPNVYGARIPIDSNWNFSLLWALSRSTTDREVVSFLRYGWPLNREMAVPLTITLKNHKGALDHPQDVEDYLQKEMEYGTLVGPLCSPPWTDRLAVSPMSTRPKKNSTRRRIITDLSWPEGASVNDGIPKNEYMGQVFHIKYPTIDHLCARAVKLAKGRPPGCIQGYKVDLHRAFRQIPICPRDWSLLGTIWKGAFFFDKVAVMGSRTGPLACQRVTNMLRHFMADVGYEVNNFVDDFMGIELLQDTWRAYTTMKNLLRDVGVCEAEDKAVPPSFVIEFLGILFNFLDMTISIPQDKMMDLTTDISGWLSRSLTTRRQLERLLGRLQFAGTCIRPGRIFVSRLIEELKDMPVGGSGLFPVGPELRKDLLWWSEGMQVYNGVSMMWLLDWAPVDGEAATDSCLSGIGGVLGNQCYRAALPGSLTQNKDWNIVHFEMLAIIVLVQLFKKELAGRRMVLYCDNDAVVSVINSGRSRNHILQRCLRWLAFLLLENECLVRMKYITSKRNHVADVMSRSQVDGQSKKECDKLIEKLQLHERTVEDIYMCIEDKW